MKGRPFLAVVLAVVLLTFSLGLGGWWLVWQRGPLQLAHHALAIPRAARFVPAQAPLSLYLLSDGEQPVAYARAVAPGRQRRSAGEAIARLRDGAFAAAGLDYHDELARWLAPGIALVLFEDPAAELAGSTGGLPAGGWLLALASRDDDGARHFLQRFWQTRSLAGTDLQVSNYRGMGLISGRGALLGSRSMPLATALVDDDLVLIASGRGVLERALDVSQIPELNQASQPGLQKQLDRLGEGAALLVARPQALEQWLGWPLPVAPGQRPTQLLASLRPEGRSLVLHGHLQLPAPPRAIGAEPISTEPNSTEPIRAEPATTESTSPATTTQTTDSASVDPGPDGPVVLPPADPLQQQQLLEGLRGQLSSLLLLQNPAAQLQQPLVQPLLQRALASSGVAGPFQAAASSGGSAEPASGGNAPTRTTGKQRQLPAQKRLAAVDQRPATGEQSTPGPLPSLVVQRAEGPLLLATGPQGWQLGTASDQPAPERLQRDLAAAGLIEAPLQRGDRSLQVWTRLEVSSQRRPQAGGGETLQATLAAWRQADGPLAWWGRNLAVLDEPAGGRGREQLQAALVALDRAEAPLQWALTGVPARELLRLWQPWQLLSALAGGGLDGAVQGMAVALEPEGSTLHVQARLRFEG